MLAPEVRFEGFTSSDWTRVLSLFRPRRADGLPRDPDRPQGGVIAVHDEHGLIKMVHTRVGRLRLDDARGDWPLSAEELAQRHHCSWALKLERGALGAIFERFGASARREDDFTTQLLTLVTLARQQMLEGRAELWPDRLDGVPMPTAPMLEGALDTVVPRGRAMLLGLFDRGELWTAIGLRRGPRGIDLIVGPEAFRDDLGLLSGDMRRDHRHLARVAAQRIGTLSLGCFAEQETLRRLEVDPTPGAWALAVAVRDVVLYPAPAAMAVPIGLDAGRAAFSALRAVASQIDPQGLFTPAFGALREVALGDRSVEEALGFHPLVVLRQLLTRDA